MAALEVEQRQSSKELTLPEFVIRSARVSPNDVPTGGLDRLFRNERGIVMLPGANP